MNPRIKLIITLLVCLMLTSVCSAAETTIKDSRATPEYWLSRTSNGDEVLLTTRQISKLNAQILAKDKYAADLTKYPSVVSADKVKEMLKETWKEDERNNSLVKGDVAVRYAVTIQRANIRLLPQAWDGDKYDDLQGTAIDPAEAVAVLLDSADKSFVFVQSRYYMGWIEKSKLAFTTRETWLTYVKSKDFLIVTDNKKTINVEGQDVLFQMGAMIPVVDAESHDDIWVMRLPTAVEGKLKEVNVNIAMNDEGINKGFLACTNNNFIRQAFKFLGNNYGWGGLYDSVDGSAFIQDIYRSMGINIPRDTSRQEYCMPLFATLADVGTVDYSKILKSAPTGSLFLKNRQAMMKLGQDDDGMPIIIYSSYYAHKVVVADVRSVGNITSICYYGN